MVKILLLLLLASAISCQNEVELHPDTVSTRSVLSDKGVNHYFVTIPPYVQENKFYLVFDVYTTADDGLSDPDIFISSVFATCSFS